MTGRVKNMAGRVKASDELYPIIMQSANEIERFTEIFSTAPVWLLEFTWMRLDAELLKFGLPRMSDKQVWGEDGLRDMMRWPLLQLGMITDGDPLPEVAVEDGVPPEQEEAYRQQRRQHDFVVRCFGSKNSISMRLITTPPAALLLN